MARLDERAQPAVAGRLHPPLVALSFQDERTRLGQCSRLSLDRSRSAATVRPMRALTGIVVLGALIALTADGKGGPVLGRAKPVPYGIGWGEVKPRVVSTGGDPTGQVRQIRWSNWGGRTAVGVGISTYVWPGTGVASNPPVQGARIVVFNRGICRGRASYNAVEWYFPRYGESFDPHSYINACTGAYAPAPSPKMIACANLRVGRRMATSIYAVAMTCAAARAGVARSHATRFVPPMRVFAWRFFDGRFRCGTAGDGRDRSLPPSYECQDRHQEYLFNLPAP